jgi:hypothetical protein
MITQEEWEGANLDILCPDIKYEEKWHNEQNIICTLQEFVPLICVKWLKTKI